MNILFDNLESLIDAPNGIEKARELILQLAIQGKLTEQDPKDEPASELLKKIKKEKETLFAEGKIKKQNDVEPINDDEKPFELPERWSWCRLGEIQNFINGYGFSSSDFTNKGIGIIKIGDIFNNEIRSSKMVYVRKEVADQTDKSIYVKYGDLVIAMSGATTGKLGFNNSNEVFLLNQRVGKLDIFLVEKKYIFFYLSTKIKEMLSISAGSAIPNLSTVQINNAMIPLPPLNEQKRIVEKANSLMALLDELEEKREHRNQKRIKLNNASLEKLLTSKNDKELKTNWERIEENFSTLYSVQENVEKLKQAILQLAVQGKLVKQDPKDEPASELLKKIKKEKEKLILEGKIKNQNELPPIKEEEKPFELPKGWGWVRLNELNNSIFPFSYGVLKPGPNVSDGVLLVKSQHINYLKVSEKIDYRITDELDQQYKRTKIKGGEILLNLVGASIGRCAIAPNWLKGANVTRAVAVMTIVEEINKEFLLFTLTNFFSEKNISKFSAGSAQPVLNLNTIRLFPIAIPPIKEQERIVRKINELMSLCNTLEEKLTKKETTAEKLVGAVVNAVANKTNKSKDEKEDKRKQRTELIGDIIKQHPKALEKLS